MKRWRCTRGMESTTWRISRACVKLKRGIEQGRAKTPSWLKFSHTSDPKPGIALTPTSQNISEFGQFSPRKLCQKRHVSCRNKESYSCYSLVTFGVEPPSPHCQFLAFPFL